MRTSKRLTLLVMAMSLSAAAGSALATPLSIYNNLRETPITKFGKADMDLMTKTVYRALDSGEDGVKVSWENPATSSSGSVTPAKDPKGRANCRLAQVENHYQSLHGGGSYIFCKSTGKAKAPPWQLVSPWPAG